MKTTRFGSFAFLSLLVTALLVALRADEPATAPQFRTEYRDQTFVIQKNVPKADGTVELVNEQVTQRVPVMVPVEANVAPTISGLIGYLGAFLEDDGEANGVRVEGLRPGGPAQSWGLKTGDLIKTIESKAIAKLDDVDAILNKTLPGQRLSFVVERAGQQQTVNVVLGAPSVSVAPASGSTPNPLTMYAAVVAPEDALDEESKKLFDAEKAAAAEAKKLTAQLPKTKTEQDRVATRTKLREKLAEVFDLQQKRRAHEVAKIEERLGKLKDTMKKRDAAKDSIVDRRMELLTGGVDELGWEETGAGRPGMVPTPYGGANAFGSGAYPTITPQSTSASTLAPRLVPSPMTLPPAGASTPQIVPPPAVPAPAVAPAPAPQTLSAPPAAGAPPALPGATTPPAPAALPVAPETPAAR